jgi:hypothetical protein
LTDLSVTTSVSNVDTTGAPADITNDGGGPYTDGVAGVVSILTQNGYKASPTAIGSSTRRIRRCEKSVRASILTMRCSLVIRTTRCPQDHRFGVANC